MKVLIKLLILFGLYLPTMFFAWVGFKLIELWVVAALWHHFQR